MGERRTGVGILLQSAAVCLLALPLAGQQHSGAIVELEGGVGWRAAPAPIVLLHAWTSGSQSTAPPALLAQHSADALEPGSEELGRITLGWHRGRTGVELDAGLRTTWHATLDPGVGIANAVFWAAGLPGLSALNFDSLTAYRADDRTRAYDIGVVWSTLLGSDVRFRTGFRYLRVENDLTTLANGTFAGTSGVFERGIIETTNDAFGLELGMEREFRGDGPLGLGIGVTVNAFANDGGLAWSDSTDANPAGGFSGLLIDVAGDDTGFASRALLRAELFYRSGPVRIFVAGAYQVVDGLLMAPDQLQLLGQRTTRATRFTGVIESPDRSGTLREGTLTFGIRVLP